MLGKVVYVITVMVLCMQHRVNPDQIVFVNTDLLLGLLFAAAFLKTPAMNEPPATVLP